ncbi:MAG: glycosyltransferase, partial [Candidatus Acidiferrales bacterium]
MSHTWLILFWAGIAWLFYVLAGYPILLLLLGWVRPFRSALQEGYLPKVSILISARNEEKDIEWKIHETLDWNYPPELLEVLVASDASEDRTDEILQRITDPRLKYLRIQQRAGKNEALNRLSALATGELLFFTDANSHVGPNCLRSMVRHFADPRVGCLTGIERNRSPEGSVEIGAMAYLEYEAVINNLESRLGSVLVCDGSNFCIRRTLFSPLQRDLANDLESPIRIGSKGFALLFEPMAWSLERSTSSIREEFNRRRRICGQGALGLWRLRGSLRGIRKWQ